MKRLTWTDHQVEQIIGQLLQIGVLVAAVVVALGGGLLLVHSGGTIIGVERYRAEPARLAGLREIFQGALKQQPLSTIQLGVLLLIATPIARVALTLFAFLFKRDWLYVLMTTIVLGLLLYGFI